MDLNWREKLFNQNLCQGKVINEGETIDKYKKRFKENWKVELDNAVARMKEEL